MVAELKGEHLPNTKEHRGGIYWAPGLTRDLRVGSARLLGHPAPAPRELRGGSEPLEPDRFKGRASTYGQSCCG